MAIKKSDDYKLLNNSRFYILSSTVLISLFVVALLRLQIESDQLFYIRTQQVFGLLCIFYWYLAVVVSPLGYVIGKNRTTYLEYARRAIGVSAAYFGVLHMLVALWGQLGGIGEIFLLPDIFRWSLLAGFLAVLILLTMAATSFDRVVNYMTFVRWKWLHRLVYVGVVLAVLHVWSIGTHLAYSWAQIISFIALAILSGLETHRFFKIFAKSRPVYQQKDYFYTMIISVWIFWLVLIFSLPAFIQNYHSRHHDASQSFGGGHSHNNSSTTGGNK